MLRSARLEHVLERALAELALLALRLRSLGLARVVGDELVERLRAPVRLAPALGFESWRRCRGKLKVSASIEDEALIERILAHRKERLAAEPPRAPFTSRTRPPQSSLF